MYRTERFESYISIENLMNTYFDFRTTRSRCIQCPGYKRTWSCPEFDFDPEDFLRGFSRFHLITESVLNEGVCSAEDAQVRLFREKVRFEKVFLEIENDIPGSCALAAQECVQCAKCARLSGLPCVHPEIMRYGPEALGLLAVRMVKDLFGITVLWSDGTSIPEYYLLIAGVMER